MKHSFKKGFCVNFSVILFIGSMILICCSSTQTVTGFSRYDVFGLAEKLDLFYWGGLSLILFSLFFLFLEDNITKTRREILFLLELCLLTQYLYSISVLKLTSVPYYDAWAHTSSSFSILISGSYTNSSDLYARQYPGAFIIQSAIFLVTALDPVILIRMHNVISPVLMSLSSYLLLRKLFLDQRKIHVATLFLVTGSVWVFSQNFAPSSFGYIWYLLLFYFVFSKYTKKTVVMSFLLIMAVVISHPTTIPFLIASLTFIFVFTSFFSKREIMLNYYEKRFFSFITALAIFILVTYSTWLVFTADKLLSDLLLTLVKSLRSLMLERAIERFQTSSVNIVGQTLKILYSLIYLITGIIGMLILLFERVKKKTKGIFFSFIAISWLSACAFLGFMTALLHGGMFYERVLLYGFIPLTILAMLTFNYKYGKVLLFFVILIGTILSIVAEYSNININYCPITDSYGSMFIVNHGINDRRTIQAALPTRFVCRFYLYYKHFQSGLNFDKLSKGENLVFIWSRVSEDYYLLYVKESGYSLVVYEKLRIPWFENFEILTMQPNATRIYDNGDFRTIYVHIER